jgi:hypothetical protein
MRVWTATNPRVIHKESLHPQKVGVCCALSCSRIIGLISFHTTANTDVYLNVFQGFVNQLDDRKLILGYFQQDGVACHMSIQDLEEASWTIELSRKAFGRPSLDILFRRTSSRGSAEEQGIRNVALQRHIVYKTMLYYSYRLHNSWHKYTTRFPSLHVSA